MSATVMEGVTREDAHLFVEFFTSETILFFAAMREAARTFEESGKLPTTMFKRASGGEGSAGASECGSTKNGATASLDG